MKSIQRIILGFFQYPITFTLGLTLGITCTFIATKDVEIVHSVQHFDVSKISKKELPELVIKEISNQEALGIDIFHSPNNPAVFQSTDELPSKHIWGKYVTVNGNENNNYLFHLPLYVYWNSEYYLIFNYLDNIKIENPPEYFFVQYELLLNKQKEVSIHIKSKEAQLDNILGPFPLFHKVDPLIKNLISKN